MGFLPTGTRPESSKHCSEIKREPEREGGKRRKGKRRKGHEREREEERGRERETEIGMMVAAPTMYRMVTMCQTLYFCHIV